MDEPPPHDNENVHVGDWLEQAEARVLDAAVARAAELGWNARLAQAALRGPRLTSLVAPARPVGFAALAAMAPATLTPRGPQEDSGVPG